jgi:uncharacterized lipoprotein YajG
MRALQVILLGVLLLLAGCDTRQYQAVPECSSASPPKGERYTNATPDEKLVQMTSAYIRQTQSLTDCNADIRLINAANKAVPK